jgi:hypothetical protein
VKALASIASIASIAVIIIAYAAPSHAQKVSGGSPAAVSGKQCYVMATSRGWRSGGFRGYRKFMRQCKAGKIPL